MQTHTPIDSSLARFVRRAYFKQLRQEWAKTTATIKRGKQRNQNFGRRLQTDKQLRECTQNFEKALGRILPISTIRLDAHSRSANVILTLSPEPVPDAVKTSSNASVTAVMLLRHSGATVRDAGVVVSGHAVDRVIQRCKMVDLPIRQVDLEAINAEFSDALPLACFACSILGNDEELGDQQAQVNILLPSANGVFLASWLPAKRKLLIKTFVDQGNLVAPQRQAVREIRSIGDGQISAHILDAVAPGWLTLERECLGPTLLSAWRNYGWRFGIDRLHPGLSDTAWQVH